MIISGLKWSAGRIRSNERQSPFVYRHTKAKRRPCAP